MNKALVVLFLLFVLGCDDDSDGGGIGNPINCTISGPVLSINTINASTCLSSDGSITATSTSEKELTFFINGSSAQSSGEFLNLMAGSYMILVEDSDGCSDMRQVQVLSETQTITINDITITSAGCELSDGQIEIDATGEGTLEYSVVIEGGSPSYTINNSFGNLTAGNYSVFIKDDSGCDIEQVVAITSGTSYVSQVQTIIQTNCAINNCHNGSRASLPDYNDFSNVQSRADAIKSRTQSGNMPPVGQPDLTQEQIDLIACWVDDGALDN